MRDGLTQEANMVSPVDFMLRYRAIPVSVAYDDPISQTCRVMPVNVKLNSYFMMDWTAGSSEAKHYDAVTADGKKAAFFQTNKDSIRTAAMGKGSPTDYSNALQWAVLSGHVKIPSQATVQTYFDQNLGIDCSGFVTNYLIANGKLPDNTTTRRDTGANSYLKSANAVNDCTQVRQGDLLVFVKGTTNLSGDGHIGAVESYLPQSMQGGNMRVVESTAASGATPKLTDSMYSVDQITTGKIGGVSCMVLVVTRFGVSGFRVCVMRP
jgi:hypothetical protein